MKTSLDKAAKLFMKYDKLLFNNKIKHADINLILTFNSSKKFMGVFVGYYINKKKCGDIQLSKRYCKNKQLFKSTIVHEMVHCIQFINGTGVNHGKFFKSECRRIKKHFRIDIK